MTTSRRRNETNRLPDAPVRIKDGVTYYRNTFAPNCVKEWLTVPQMFMGFKFGMANGGVPGNALDAVNDYAQKKHGVGKYARKAAV